MMILHYVLALIFYLGFLYLCNLEITKTELFRNKHLALFIYVAEWLCVAGVIINAVLQTLRLLGY